MYKHFIYVSHRVYHIQMYVFIIFKCHHIQMYVFIIFKCMSVKCVYISMSLKCVYTSMCLSYSNVCVFIIFKCISISYMYHIASLLAFSAVFLINTYSCVYPKYRYMLFIYESYGFALRTECCISYTYIIMLLSYILIYTHFM